MSLGFASLLSGFTEGMKENEAANEKSRLKAAQLFRQLKADNPHANFETLVKLRKQAAGGQNWLAKGIATDDLLKVMSESNLKAKQIADEEEAARSLARRQAFETDAEQRFAKAWQKTGDDEKAFDLVLENTPESSRDTVKQLLSPERRKFLQNGIVQKQTSDLMKDVQNGATIEQIRRNGELMGYSKNSIEVAIEAAKKRDEDREWTQKTRKRQEETWGNSREDRSRAERDRATTLRNQFIDNVSKATIAGADPNIYKDNFLAAGGTEAEWAGVLQDGLALAENPLQQKELTTEAQIMKAIGPLLRSGKQVDIAAARGLANQIARANGYRDWSESSFDQLQERMESEGLVAYNAANRGAYAEEFNEQVDDLTKNYNKKASGSSLKTSVAGVFAGLVDKDKHAPAIIGIAERLTAEYYLGQDPNITVSKVMQKAVMDNLDEWQEVLGKDEKDGSFQQAAEKFFQKHVAETYELPSKDAGIKAVAGQRAKAVAPQKVDFDDWRESQFKKMGIIRAQFPGIEEMAKTNPKEAMVQIQKIERAMADTVSGLGAVSYNDFLHPNEREFAAVQGEFKTVAALLEQAKKIVQAPIDQVEEENNMTFFTPGKEDLSAPKEHEDDGVSLMQTPMKDIPGKVFNRIIDSISTQGGQSTNEETEKVMKELARQISRTVDPAEKRRLTEQYKKFQALAHGQGGVTKLPQ